MARFCEWCGQQMADGQLFCSACGKPADHPGAAVPPQQVPQQQFEWEQTPRQYQQQQQYQDQQHQVLYR